MRVKPNMTDLAHQTGAEHNGEAAHSSVPPDSTSEVLSSAHPEPSFAVSPRRPPDVSSGRSTTAEAHSRPIIPTQAMSEAAPRRADRLNRGVLPVCFRDYHINY